MAGRPGIAAIAATGHFRPQNLEPVGLPAMVARETGDDRRPFIPTGSPTGRSAINRDDTQPVYAAIVDRPVDPLAHSQAD